VNTLSQMRSLTVAAIALAATLLAPAASPQTKAPQRPSAASPTASDRLGMACAQILEMSSTDWTAKFTEAKGSTPQSATNAISTYGKCYDSHTDSLAASLARKGSGPAKKPRADFAQFETAVKAFSAKAVADVQPPPDPQKAAYINLFEKQFRREFYSEYEQKAVNRPLTPDESDEYRKAKNRFGELLGLLPEDKAHELHAAFGDVIGSHPVSLPMNLALYRYAIFILEPASDKPFGPPPF
jgi:hypothetical protein